MAGLLEYLKQALKSGDAKTTEEGVDLARRRLLKQGAGAAVSAAMPKLPGGDALKALGAPQAQSIPDLPGLDEAEQILTEIQLRGVDPVQAFSALSGESGLGLVGLPRQSQLAYVKELLGNRSIDDALGERLWQAHKDAPEGHPGRLPDQFDEIMEQNYPATEYDAHRIAEQKLSQALEPDLREKFQREFMTSDLPAEWDMFGQKFPHLDKLDRAFSDAYSMNWPSDYYVTQIGENTSHYMDLLRQGKLGEFRALEKMIEENPRLLESIPSLLDDANNFRDIADHPFMDFAAKDNIDFLGFRSFTDDALDGPYSWIDSDTTREGALRKGSLLERAGLDRSQAAYQRLQQMQNTPGQPFKRKDYDELESFVDQELLPSRDMTHQPDRYAGDLPIEDMYRRGGRVRRHSIVDV